MVQWCNGAMVLLSIKYCHFKNTFKKHIYIKTCGLNQGDKIDIMYKNSRYLIKL